MKADVFVSYSSKDKTIADAMVHFLEEQKIRCWIAPRDIPGGSDYPDAIAGALKDVGAVVFICSENSLNSIWCKKEVERALNYNKNIFPFKIADTELISGWDILISLEHWIDAIPDPEEKFGKIAADLRKFLDHPAKPKRADQNGKDILQSTSNKECYRESHVAIPILGKAVDEVTLTGLTGEDTKHFKKALGYYRVLRRRSALEELQKIKKQDDPVVRYYVLRFKYELDGTVSDDELEEACCAARDLGCTDAMVAFAEMHLLNYDKAFDTVLPVECIEGLKKAIEKGNADALMQLSLAYERGKGLVKDVSMARQLLKKASDSGSLRGKFAYGLDLITGECGEKDEGNAMTILTPLVEHLQHHEEELTVAEHALLALFYLTQSADDMDSVWKHFKFVEESRGHSLSDNKAILEFAYYFMGLKLLSDTTNTDNAKLAVEYFHKAISIGVNGLGELGLAECYDNGYGLEQDDKKSLELYQKAASKGNGDAQTILVGKFLEDDENQGIEKGKNWLKLAAEDGSAMAEHHY